MFRIWQDEKRENLNKIAASFHKRINILLSLLEPKSGQMINDIWMKFSVIVYLSPLVIIKILTVFKNST
jgi:hypothetical protein